MEKAYVKYILSLLLFGANGIVASHIQLASFEIVFLRILLGALTLLAIYLFMGNKFTAWTHKKDLVYLLFSGMALGASSLFLFEAYRIIGVSVSSLLYYCGPIIVMALSPLLFNEKLTMPKVTGFGVVIFGILLVNGQSLDSGGDFIGILFGIMSAIMYAVMVIFNKKAKNIVGLENSMLQLWAALIPPVAYLMVKQGFTSGVPAESWPWILLLGIVSTGIGGYLYFSAMGKLPVQTVSICGYLDPLTAVVFSVIFLGETMLPLQIVGGILIIGGAIFGECIKGRRAPFKTT